MWNQMFYKLYKFEDFNLVDLWDDSKYHNLLIEMRKKYKCTTLKHYDFNIMAAFSTYNIRHEAEPRH